MSAATVLLAPWRATPRWARWYVRIVALLAMAIALALGLFMRRGDPLTMAIGVFCLALAFLGLFLLAPTVLLAIDARQLRVPRMRRDAELGAALWATLCIGVPTGVLGAAGAPVGMTACLMAVALSGGLVLGLVSRYVVAALCLLPAALGALAPHLTLPDPGEHGFLGVAVPLLVGLLTMAAWSWRRQLGANDPYREDWTQPMVLQFRRPARASGWGQLSGGLPSSEQQIRQQPDWLAPEIALGPSGPQQPRYSLRVALGGMFAPLTPLGRMRQLAVSVLPSVIVVVLLTVQNARHHREGQPFAGASHEAMLWGWFAAFLGLLVTLLALVQLGQRWQKHNGELPLLALLPGLGTPAGARRTLLQASLMPGLGVQSAGMVLVLALGLGLHMGWVTTAALLLTQLGALGLLVGFTLSIIGGRPVAHWASGAIALASLVLAGTSLFVSLVGQEAVSMAGGRLLPSLVSGWLLLLLALLWLGSRGWRGLARRPHPFMANEG